MPTEQETAMCCQVLALSVCNVMNERRFSGPVEVKLRFGRKLLIGLLESKPNPCLSANEQDVSDSYMMVHCTCILRLITISSYYPAYKSSGCVYN